MALYTFYPYQTRGDASSFDSLDLADDTAALIQAVTIFEQHSSAVRLEVWCGERLVYAMPRDDARPPRRLLDRSG